jgi:hypothetical protein
MRLFEFASPDPLVTKLVAVSDQLKTELSQDQAKTNMSVKQFLEYLQKYDINIDKLDLFNMIKNPPLKNIIDNIQGDNIVFKGFAEPEMPDDQQKAVVQQMAKKASDLPK